MPNIKDPGQTTRRLIATVAYSQMLYAAPIVSEAVRNSRKLRIQLEKVQRACALRIISAYRTISTDAASVLAGLPLIDLLLRERKDLYETKLSVLNIDSYNREKVTFKKNARDSLFESWQNPM